MTPEEDRKRDEYKHKLREKSRNELVKRDEERRLRELRSMKYIDFREVAEDYEERKKQWAG